MTIFLSIIAIVALTVSFVFAMLKNVDNVDEDENGFFDKRDRI